MRFRLLALFALIASLGAASAQTSVPATLLAAIDATEAAKADYAFDFAVETRGRAFRFAFDPAADPRTRLVSPSEGALDNDARRLAERIADDLDGISWCATRRLRDIADVRLLREDGDTAAYAFQPTAASSRGALAQLAQHLRGEMVLSKQTPDIRSMRIYAPAPFSPMPLTDVSAVEARIECQAAPNGRNYVAHTQIRLVARAFGQSLEESSIQRTSALEPR